MSKKKKRRTKSGKQKVPGRKTLPSWAVIPLILTGVAALGLLFQEDNARKHKAASTNVSPPSTPQSLEREALSNLYKVMSTHPHASVREGFVDLIKRGEIALNAQSQVGGSHLIAGMVVFLDQYGNYRPTLHISPHSFTDPNASLPLQQLVLYHEYEHYLQMVNGKVPFETFFAAQGKAEEAALNLLRNEQVFRNWFDAEYVAYLKECRLAVELGIEEELDVCVIFAENGEAALRQGVANMFCRGLPFISKTGRCPLVQKIAKEPSTL